MMMPNISECKNCSPGWLWFYLAIIFCFDANELIFPLNAIPAKLETSIGCPHQKKYGINFCSI
jgi:hypothetical protein